MEMQALNKAFFKKTSKSNMKHTRERDSSFRSPFVLFSNFLTDFVTCPAAMQAILRKVVKKKKTHATVPKGNPNPGDDQYELLIRFSSLFSRRRKKRLFGFCFYVRFTSRDR